MDTETTSPIETDDTAIATVQDDTEVEQFVDTDEDGNPIEGPPEEEEIEIDPELKLKVPKDQAQKLKDAILRQADYTRKTQEVAELKRATGEALQHLQTMDGQEFAARSNLYSIDQQLSQYANVNWSAAMEQARANQDEDAKAGINAAFMHYTQLTQQRQQAMGLIGQAQQQRASYQQQEAARLMEQGRAELAKHVPEWNDTHRANLVNYAAQYGFTAQELGDLEADPRAARILHEAFIGSQARQKAAKTQQITAAQQVQPAAMVGGSSPPAGKLDDRLSADEWLRRRNAQARKRA